MTAPVASYARRSKRAAGDGKGAFINIADQHAQNRAYAATAFPGAPVVEYDDNMSAWNPDVTRENWELLLEDVRAGKLRAVIGRYADRLTRQPEQGEQLLTACKRGRAELHTTSAGHISSALMFRIELAMAAEESDQKSRRLLDKHRTLDAAGAFSGGRRRFGYLPKMAGIVDAEAAAIREAMDAVLDGDTLAAIGRRWNAAGLLSAEGNPWQTRTVGATLRREYLTGMRNGKAAAWPAIVDATTHAAVKRRLSSNVQLGNGAVHAGRAYGLSGLILCGQCGRPMYGRPTHLKSGPAYACRNPAREASHGQAPTADVEGTVKAEIIARLTRVDAAGVFTPDVDRDAAARRQAEREELTANRRETVRNVRMAPDDKQDALDAIDGRLAELDAEDGADADAVARPARVLAGLTGMPADETRRAFDALPLDRQRAVIAELGTPILRRDPSPVRGVFNPSRVFMAWNG